MSAAPHMPSLQEAMAAMMLRRDVDPPGETAVTVKVTTCANGHVVAGGHTLDVSGEALVAHDRIPMRFATVELQMFPTHLRALRAEFEKNKATPEEIDRATSDLWNDLLALDAVESGSPPSSAEILRAFDAGKMAGATDRFYRPSFAASFRNVHRRDFYPVIAVEAAEESQSRKARA